MISDRFRHILGLYQSLDDDLTDGESKLVESLEAWAEEDPHLVAFLLEQRQHDEDQIGRAVVYLLSRLAQSGSAASQTARAALHLLTEEDLDPAMLRDVVIGLGRSQPGDSFVFGQTNHSDPAVRSAVAMVLVDAFFAAESRDLALNALLTYASDPAPEVREWAVHGLASVRAFGQIRDRRVDEALAAAMTDPSDHVRAEAMEGLTLDT